MKKQKTKKPFKRIASYFAGGERGCKCGEDCGWTCFNGRQSHFFMFAGRRIRVVFDALPADGGHIATARDPHPEDWRRLLHDERKPTRWRTVFRGTVAEVQDRFFKMTGHRHSCVGRDPKPKILPKTCGICGNPTKDNKWTCLCDPNPDNIDFSEV